MLLFATLSVGAGEKRRIDWEEASKHWAFQPIERKELTPVKMQGWAQTPMDFFILARLEAAGLEPSPPADRRTFIRRVTFDLTGLPPTPEEVQRYLENKNSDADEVLVDGLLNQPSFGERMASFWLTLTRYADDQAQQNIMGRTTLNYPNAWRYREWVVNAFNQDLRYDSFVRKQLATDLDEPENLEDLPALGFIGLGHKLYGRGKLEVKAEEWADQVDTLSQTFLGLTVVCARCHDHKYDPITMEDYHALAGVFASTELVNRKADGTNENTRTISTEFHKDTIHIVEDGTVQNLTLFRRGDVEDPQEPVQRGFLQVLSPNGESIPFRRGSGRSELAEQIVHPDNPLTARIFVNRIWGLLFGRALAVHPSNFGFTGTPPTHPELLDDLTARWMANGWSIKSLVREIALSATYRQSSAIRPEGVAIDEGNELWWRMDTRRLTVEMLRDAFLSVSGELEAGGGVSLSLGDPKHRKRTLYSVISRQTPDKLLTLFDYPDANVHVEIRKTSTTPMQKLYLMNSPFVLEQAKALSERIHLEAPSDDRSRIRYAFELLYAREPDPSELSLALSFLEKAEETSGLRPWPQLAQAMLTTNEMIYVD